MISLCVSENTTDFKSERDRLASMRAGASRAPPQPLYRPGSGPLRKSGRLDEFDNESALQERPKIPSVQDRLKHSRFNNPNHMQNSSQLHHIDNITEKLDDMHVNSRNYSNSDQTQNQPKNNHCGAIDPRKKNKKPEQQLYVPKKVKEAHAEQEVPTR